MLAITLILLTQIGAPAGVHLLDAPLLAPARSDAEVSARQLQLDIDGLRKMRPGVGGGVALLCVGGTAAILGALYMGASTALSFGGMLSPMLVIGAICLGAGLPLAVIGLWIVINRLEERKRIDDETMSLKRELQRRQYEPRQTRGPDASVLLAQFD